VAQAAKLAELAQEVAVVELEDARRRVRKETAESYYLTVLARESSVRLEQMTLIFREIETDRRAAFDLGAIYRQGLLEIKARSAEAAQGLLEARESEFTALAGLAYFTTTGRAALTLVSGFPPERSFPDEELLLQRSEEHSPALQKLRLQAEQARRDVARVRGGDTFRPDLGLRLALEITG